MPDTLPQAGPYIALVGLDAMNNGVSAHWRQRFDRVPPRVPLELICDPTRVLSLHPTGPLIQLIAGRQVLVLWKAGGVQTLRVFLRPIEAFTKEQLR
ncbi:hypothetical protein G6F22_015516 [Rhizopus arrhizus]|nr:hypothetical protein G6F22_015516 [Rhizopus arrhizus]KAG1079802.1 hypothetical protein G6F40_016154 [Rhizopus arrhizus]KAG1247121.1 hypothetical protein G6F65_020330 [Rhizopus arrhizus]